MHAVSRRLNLLLILRLTDLRSVCQTTLAKCENSMHDLCTRQSHARDTDLPVVQLSDEDVPLLRVQIELVISSSCHVWYLNVVNSTHGLTRALPKARSRALKLEPPYLNNHMEIRHLGDCHVISACLLFLSLSRQTFEQTTRVVSKLYVMRLSLIHI